MMTNPLFSTSLPRRRWLRATGLIGTGAVTTGWLWHQFVSPSIANRRYPTTIETARHTIRAAMDKRDVSSASVALIDGGRIVWQEAFGHIDQSRKKAASPATLFAMGSISKLIAAIAALRLVDRGLLSLDAPIKQYMPGFRMASEASERITARMLLIHSSGLASTDGRNLFTQTPAPGYAKQLLKTLSGTRLKYPPGEMAVYCNDDFTLLESLIESISGKPYARFIADEFFTPLRMQQSRFPLELIPSGSYAPPYVGSTMQPQECINAYASGGLYSTPTELAELAAVLIQGGVHNGHALLSSRAMSEFFANQHMHLQCNPLNQAPGLGWDSVAHPAFAARGIQALHKDGQTAFFSSQFFLLPKEELAFLIVGASPDFGTEEIAIQTLLNALTEKGFSARNVTAQPNAPTRIEALRPLPEGVAYYASNYGLLRVQSSGTAATVNITTRQDSQWNALRDRSPPGDNSAANTATGTPHPSYAQIHDGGRDYLIRRREKPTGEVDIEMLGQKITPGLPTPHAWEKRTNRKWLCVNDHPQSILLLFGSPLFTLTQLPELPGYLFAGYKRTILQIIKPADGSERAETVVQIPGRTGSNIDDVSIEKRKGEEWLRFGSFLYRPFESVPELRAGANTQRIGTEQLAEWCRIPSQTTVSISGARHWHVFDEGMVLVASGDAQASQLPPQQTPSYLILFADAGTQIRLECLSAT